MFRKILGIVMMSFPVENFLPGKCPVCNEEIIEGQTIVGGFIDGGHHEWDCR